ncbi:helix-turn-helix domain-containing protein [Streptomyces sp. NEAU-174]|uniref:helix-turn-helix domain-containing protein n=1 Tax=Streptomyces sp. NEAU-174 TaxID=3458254 RepID=UPI0040443F83
MVAYMRTRGTDIRRKREEAGHGLNAFARVVGIAPSHLSRIERNETNPSPEVQKRIAEALGVAIKEIAEHEEEETDERPVPPPGVTRHEHQAGRRLRPPHPQCDENPSTPT